MPRIYLATFENVLVSAPQDLLQITGASGRMVRILKLAVSCTDTTVAQVQQLSLRYRFLPATVTPGTGGTSVTPRQLDPGDANATFTCLANNTSKATTSGTPFEYEAVGVNLYAGYDYQFPKPPLVGPGEALVFELLSTVTGTVHLSGSTLVEESGG